MKVNGIARRTIAALPDGSVEIIDQTLLPERFELRRISTAEEMGEAIKTMRVRGAPLIGVAAAYGFALGLRKNADDASMERIAKLLIATRPTEVNLRWALERIASKIRPLAPERRAAAAFAEAGRLAEEDVEACRAMGRFGAELLRGIKPSGDRLNVLTHCNAGWLATVDWGTALAPIYMLHDEGVPVHVWVSETRPRSQGRLTAWELGRHGVPYTFLVDNAAGHLLQRGGIDAVIVGTDRTTRSGDVTNKIGTYLKALAAREAGVPFYVAAPSSSIDWSITDWRTIPIEDRGAAEVCDDAEMRVANPGFDVTPAALVTRLITERGVCAPEALRSLFPEHAS